MGVSPSVTAVLVDATPYRLRYLLTSTGQPGSAVLTNQNSLPAGAGIIIGGVDLRVNARSAAESGVLGLPLLVEVSLAVVDAAGARRVLMGESGSPPVINARGVHAHSSISARGTTTTGVGGAWSVDADEGAAAGSAPSAGFAVLVILPPAAAANDQAYLDVHLKHTEDL